MEPNTEQITEQRSRGREKANRAIQEALLNAIPADQIETVRAGLKALLPQIKNTYLPHEVDPATQTVAGFLGKLPQPEPAPQETTRE